MDLSKKRISLDDRILILFCLMSFTMTSCEKSLDDFCSSGSIQIHEKITLALHRLEIERLKKSPVESSVPLIESERLDWEKWGFRQLKECEQYLEIIGNERKIQEVESEISQMINLWVEFHGFSQSGDAEKMAATLKKIQSLAEKAQSAACQVSQRKDLGARGV